MSINRYIKFIGLLGLTFFTTAKADSAHKFLENFNQAYIKHASCDHDKCNDSFSLNRYTTKEFQKQYPKFKAAASVEMEDSDGNVVLTLDYDPIINAQDPEAVKKAVFKTVYFKDNYASVLMYPSAKSAPVNCFILKYEGGWKINDIFNLLDNTSSIIKGCPIIVQTPFTIQIKELSR